MSVKSNEKLVSKFTNNCICLLLVYIVWNIVILFVYFKFGFVWLLYTFWLLVVTNHRLMHLTLWSLWKTVMLRRGLLDFFSHKCLFDKSFFRLYLILNRQSHQVDIFRFNDLIYNWYNFVFCKFNWLNKALKLSVNILNPIDKIYLSWFRCILKDSFS